MPALGVHNALHPALKEYLTGLLAVRAGNCAEAREALKRLGALGGTAETPARASLWRGLAATLARAEEGPLNALAVLGRPAIELWFQVTVASPFLSLAHERFLRAELLHEVGREAEALGWYGSIAQRSPYELVYAGPAHLRRAEIFALQGDREAANSEYELGLACWTNADPELQRDQGV
jgi:tetratricopeptide (TPR) repeat protein